MQEDLKKKKICKKGKGVGKFWNIVNKFNAAQLTHAQYPPYMLNVVNMCITLLGSYSRIPTQTFRLLKI